MKQTLIYKHPIGTGKKHRMLLVGGDRVDEINSGPSYSFNGEEYYCTARLVTSKDRKTKWYNETLHRYSRAL